MGEKNGDNASLHGRKEKGEIDTWFEGLPEESKTMVNLCKDIEKWRDEMKESGKMDKYAFEYLIYAPIDRSRVYSNVGADTKEWTKDYIRGYSGTYRELQSCSRQLEEYTPQMIKDKIAIILKQIESDWDFITGKKKE